MKVKKKPILSSAVLLRLTKDEHKEFANFAHSNGMSYGRFVMMLIRRFAKQSAVGGVISGVFD